MNKKMSHQLAMDIADSMDLPDGAYWAMIEEMSGAEPADYVGTSDWYTYAERKKYKAQQRAETISQLPKRIKYLEILGHKVLKLTDGHYRINDNIDWWPTTDKWRYLDATGKASQLFQRMLDALHKNKLKAKGRGNQDD